MQEVRRLEDAASRNEEELGNLAPAGLSSTENRGIRYIIRGIRYIIIIRGLQTDVVYYGAQSRQRAKLFSSRRNWDSPTQPLTRRRVSSPPGSGGEGHTRWESPNSDELGYIHCGTLYIYVLYDHG